ncbi:MAG: AIPR family protein [Dehalococcoidia bacterium]
MPSRSDSFDRVSSQARTDEAGGLTSDRAVLLLWYLRNVVGLDSLDAYDYVCDGPNDWGVDGLYLEKDVDGTEVEHLKIFQSKYSTAPNTLKKRDVQGLIAAAEQFRTAANLETMLRGPIEPRLAALIKEFRLVEKVREGRLADGRLRLDLVLVTTGVVDGHAKAAADAANGAEGRSDYITSEDIDRLGPIAVAVDSRTPRPETLEVQVPSNDVLITGSPGERVAVVPLQAAQIVQWPGIDDRSLFDLNVRRAMGRNRVQGELDGAVAKTDDHPKFLAYHNGLTVVCDSFEVVDPDVLRIARPSVVNGAQSVIAFARNAAGLTGDLRVFVKLVEVATRPNLAREVSRRSNTQNPVNPRMLMANSGPQLRLEQEFAAEFPGVEYITKPDAELKPTGRFINNDDAAQLLTAVFLQRPELAVKRNSLFESENHAAVFTQSHSAAHVMLAHEIGQAIDRVQSDVPDHFRGSWKLTRIVMVYLAGQILRAGQEAGDHKLIADPSSSFQAGAPDLTPDTLARLDDAAQLAAFALQERFDARGEADDYKKDFKNEGELRAIGAAASSLYRVRGKLPPKPSGI